MSFPSSTVLVLFTYFNLRFERIERVLRPMLKQETKQNEFLKTGSFRYLYAISMKGYPDRKTNV